MTDTQDRSERASPYKLDEARKKGQVARSPEMQSFVMIATFLAVFAASAWGVARVIAEHAFWWLGQADQLGRHPGYLMSQVQHSSSQIVSALLPLFGALFCMAISGNLLVNGFVMSAEPLKPDFQRLNPVAGLRRMWSRRVLVETVKILAKGLMFALAFYYLLQGLMPRLLHTATLSLVSLPEVGRQLLITMGYALLLVMAAAAVFDFWYTRQEFARQMRMSLREVKEEYKHREGDPQIRAKQKSAQQSLLRKSAALSAVGNADVIVTNPTHYAVALQYRPASMVSPVVLAMGRGQLAHRIMALARQQGVPILRRPALARLLHALGDVDQPIPLASQADVASVYRWVIAIPGNKVLTL